MKIKSILRKKAMVEQYVNDMFDGTIEIGSYLFDKKASVLLRKNEREIEIMGHINERNLNSIKIDIEVLHISNELVQLLKKKYNIYIYNNLWRMYEKDIKILKTDKEVYKLYRKM